MNKEKNLWFWIASFVFTIIPVIILICVTRSDLKHTNTICLWILGAVYLLLLWRYAFFVYFLNRFYRIKRSFSRYCVISLSVAGLIFGLLLLPFHLGNVIKTNIASHYLLENQSFQLINTGEKNPNSPGQEVCIEGITIDGSNYNLFDIPAADGWEYVDNRPVSLDGSSAPLEINLNAKYKYGIMLRQGPDKGIARIQIGDLIDEKIDLYLEKNQNRDNLYN